jgi:CheY-like chemotaxis protein
MRHLSIAFVEDNPTDLYLLETYLRTMGADYDRTLAVDGEEALACLSHCGAYAEAPKFDLIFMNMRLPKFNTPEVLKMVAGSEDLPICVLTGSPEDKSLIEKHFRSRAVSYLIKPVDRQKIIQCFRCHEHLKNIADELETAAQSFLRRA